MAIKYSDNALTLLYASIGASDTLLTVSPGDGDKFPAVDSGADYFVITMEDAAANREFIRVDHRLAGADTFGSGGYPCQRGYWGSTARAWTAGDSVDLRWSANAIEGFVTSIAASEAAASADADDADTARIASVTAQGLSESARDASVTAQGLSESARDASVTAQGLSEAARDASVTAKGLSESARDASVTAQGLSEGARDASVTAQGLSEDARDAAAISAVAAEAWAEEAEDVEVATGQYSAFHWAQKAHDLVVDGLIDDGAASVLTTWSSSKVQSELREQMQYAAGQGYMLPNWDTTFTPADQPTVIEMIEDGATGRKMKWTITYSGDNPTSIVWSYDSGAGYATLTGGTQTISYDGNGDITGVASA